MITFKKQIIEPARPIVIKNQISIRAGIPLPVLVGKDDKRGKLWTRNGWLIWDGDNFIFIPWRKNSKLIKKEGK